MVDLCLNVTNKEPTYRFPPYHVPIPEKEYVHARFYLCGLIDSWIVITKKHSDLKRFVYYFVIDYKDKKIFKSDNELYPFFNSRENQIEFYYIIQNDKTHLHSWICKHIHELNNQSIK